MSMNFCDCDHGQEGRSRTEMRLEFAGGLWDAKISRQEFLT